MLTWGDDGKRYKYSEVIQGVSRDAGESAKHLKSGEEECVLLVRTTGKDIVLVAPTKEVATVWYAKMEKILEAIQSLT